MICNTIYHCNLPATVLSSAPSNPGLYYSCCWCHSLSEHIVNKFILVSPLVNANSLKPFHHQLKTVFPQTAIPFNFHQCPQYTLSWGGFGFSEFYHHTKSNKSRWRESRRAYAQQTFKASSPARAESFTTSLQTKQSSRRISAQVN